LTKEDCLAESNRRAATTTGRDWSRLRAPSGGSFQSVFRRRALRRPSSR